MPITQREIEYFLSLRREREEVISGLQNLCQNTNKHKIGALMGETCPSFATYSSTSAAEGDDLLRLLIHLLR